MLLLGVICPSQSKYPFWSTTNKRPLDPKDQSIKYYPKSTKLRRSMRMAMSGCTYSLKHFHQGPCEPLDVTCSVSKSIMLML